MTTECGVWLHSGKKGDTDGNPGKPNQVRSGLIVVCHHPLPRFDECTRGTGEVSCGGNQMRRHMSTLCDFPAAGERGENIIVNERFIKIFPREVLAEIDNIIQK